MLPSRKRLFLGALAGIALAFVAWFQLGTPTTIASDQSDVTSRFLWKAGTQRSYAFAIDSEIEIGSNTGGSHHHRLAGTLRMQIFGTKEDTVEIGCQLSELDQVVDGQPAPEAKLETFFVVHADTTGRFARFEFPASLDQATSERLRGMIKTFQIIIPHDADSTWTTAETDSNGRYTAVYRTGRGGLVKKSRIRYTTGSARILSSSAQATLARAGSWLEQSQVEETQRLRSDDGQPVLVTTKASLRPTSGSHARWRTRPRDRLIIEARRLEHAELAVAEARTRPATAADRQRLRDLIARLDASGQLGDFLQQVRALLDECPELAESIVQRLRIGDLEDKTGSALIHALRLSGHESAQAALAGIARDTQHGRANRIRALIDLGNVTRPTAATSAELWKLVGRRAVDSEIANTAMLALGRVGNRLRQQGGDEYEGLQLQLRDELATAGTAAARTNVLTAIGNTGDTRFVPEVSPHLRAAAATTRAAAAKALGRLSGSHDPLLEALRTEPNARVRTHLVASLAKQDGGTRDALTAIERRIERETNPNARFAMARYLGERLDQHPTGRRTLERVLAQESSNRIRRYIAGRIYSK